MLRIKWERNFFKYERRVIFVVTALFIWWVFEQDGFATIDVILGTNRSEFYSTLATIFGSLLGFVIVAVSIAIAALKAERLDPLRTGRVAADLWRVFFSSIRWLGSATVVSLAALLLDRPTDPKQWVIIGVFFAGLYALVRLLRTIWALEHLTALAGDDRD